MSEAKAKGYAFYDQTSEQQIVSLEAVRQALWDKHLQNPTMAKLCEEWRWEIR